MDTYNPYEAPEADLSAGSPSYGTATEQYTPNMVQFLEETKPWVRFLSVLGFIGVGMFVLAGLGMVGLGLFGLLTDGSFEEAGFMAITGVFYAFMSVFYLIPLIPLHRYANSIGHVVAGGGAPAVEQALLQQKTFWKVCGIVAIVAIVVPMVLGAIGMVVAVVVGATAAAS